jgi:hypothetical protein
MSSVFSGNSEKVRLRWLQNADNDLRELKVNVFIKLYELRRVGPLLGNYREISNCTTAVTRQRRVNSNRGTVFSMQSVPRCYNHCKLAVVSTVPCGGEVEYLHRDPASRGRRRKGKSQIWDSKIWSRVLRDTGPRNTMLAKASSI